MSMLFITIDLMGKDAVFISNCYRYHSGLANLALYRNPPPGLPSLEQAKERIDALQSAFEGGTTGNRVHIELRNIARRDVTDMFKRIISYLQSVATDEDIPALIQAGFGVRRFFAHKKSAAAPVS
ncbi:hypothetical protein GMSM_18620 [Geomonas sp. Red276]